MYFVDLPGYGYARVSLEERRSWGQMVEVYLRSRPNLKSVVVILDIRREPGQGDMDLLQWLRTYGKEPILVLTKSDKLSRQQSLVRAKKIRAHLEEIVPVAPVVFSSKTREGREEIWKRIRQVTGSDRFPAHTL